MVLRLYMARLLNQGKSQHPFLIPTCLNLLNITMKKQGKYALRLQGKRQHFLD